MVAGNGQKRCITVSTATLVRAEDGRWIQNCDSSPFYDSRRKFITDNASRSTSQAANVVKAMNFLSTTILVDEDVSAAKFISRDR